MWVLLLLMCNIMKSIIINSNINIIIISNVSNIEMIIMIILIIIVII